MDRIVAVIPARGGSKTIPRKNIKPFLGKPLIYYSIRAALTANSISEVYVSTEDAEIKRISKSFGATIIDRPMELAGDQTSTFGVIQHSGKTLNSPDIIVVLQPTSPMRTAEEIDVAIQLLDAETETVVSVCEIKKYLWEIKGGFGKPLFFERLPRQEMRPMYFENGSIYVTRSKVYRENDDKLGMGISSKGKTKLYLMNDRHAIDIDTESDWIICENVLRLEMEDF